MKLHDTILLVCMYVHCNAPVILRIAFSRRSLSNISLYLEILEEGKPVLKSDRGAHVINELPF